jgi:hypothetical protein
VLFSYLCPAKRFRRLRMATKGVAFGNHQLFEKSWIKNF